MMVEQKRKKKGVVVMVIVVAVCHHPLLPHHRNECCCFWCRRSSCSMCVVGMWFGSLSTGKVVAWSWNKIYSNSDTDSSIQIRIECSSTHGANRRV